MYCYMTLIMLLSALTDYSAESKYHYGFVTLKFIHMKGTNLTAIIFQREVQIRLHKKDIRNIMS